MGLISYAAGAGHPVFLVLAVPALAGVVFVAPKLGGHSKPLVVGLVGVLAAAGISLLLAQVLPQGAAADRLFLTAYGVFWCVVLRYRRPLAPGIASVVVMVLTLVALGLDENSLLIFLILLGGMPIWLAATETMCEALVGRPSRETKLHYGETPQMR